VGGYFVFMGRAWLFTRRVREGAPLRPGPPRSNLATALSIWHMFLGVGFVVLVAIALAHL